jgi:hypothetical protein
MDPTIRQILRRLDPQLAEGDFEPGYTSGVHKPLRAVQKGLGILRDQDLWTAKLAPDPRPSSPTSFIRGSGPLPACCGTPAGTGLDSFMLDWFAWLVPGVMTGDWFVAGGGVAAGR